MEGLTHSNGYGPIVHKKPQTHAKKLSLSNLLHSSSLRRLTVHTYPRGYMEPEVLPLGRHGVGPPKPPGTLNTSSPILPGPMATSSCSNLPSASPASSMDANHGTLMEDMQQLQNSWSSDGLSVQRHGSPPLTAGRSTDGLLVSGDRESPYYSGQSIDAVHSNSSGDKEDYSSGHASMSSDDMSRTTSPLSEANFMHSDSRYSSTRSHRSQIEGYDSPSQRHRSKKSLSSESLPRSTKQYSKECPPSDYHSKSNGSYSRPSRHPSGSSLPDDRQFIKSNSLDSKDIYNQRSSRTPSPRTPSPRHPSLESPMSDSPKRTPSPRNMSPRSSPRSTPRNSSPRNSPPRNSSPRSSSPRNSSPRNSRGNNVSPKSSFDFDVDRHENNNKIPAVDENDTMPDTLASMSMGTAVVKVKGPGRCAVKTLYLESNKTSIRWKPSKKGSKARINIDVIKEVRDGESTDILKRLGPSGSQYKTSCCFSIVYGTAWESLDVIADDQKDAEMWIAGLRYLIATSKRDQLRMRSQQHRDQWLRATFEAADKSGDGLLSIDEILKLLHKLNVSLSKRKVKLLFKEADSNTEDDNVGQLSYDEFIHFYKTISTREELDSILREYGHGKGHLTIQELSRFLSLEQQMDDVTIDHCVDIIRHYEPIPENSKNGWIGIDGFARYLLCREGDVFNPRHYQVNQDMDQPLAHYYIASSHNTYLVGDQLMSQSSVDVYAMALQAGCRCVEMDCWDGKDGEPIIYHGYTLTSRIKFRDVITVINKYAFVASPYPVILSIENHCSLDQQKKMAKYIVDILGDKLEVPTIASVSSHLPSPEQLRGRILIKSKKINWDYLRSKMASDEDAKKLPLDHNDDLEAGEVSEEDSADELDEDFKLEKRSMSQRFESLAMAQMALMKKKPIKPSQSAWKRIAAKAREQQQETAPQPAGNNTKATSLTGTLRRLKLNKKKPKSQSSSESESGEPPYTGEDSDAPGSRTSSFDKDEANKPESPSSKTAPQTIPRAGGAPRSKGKRIVLSKQLSELVKITRSVNFRGFVNLPCWELPSLGEMRASNMVATKPTEFVAFTTRHMCRVYPSAYRIDSSNYNPQPMWNCGCQLVALNYQTEGRPMQLSQALFSGNGNCGYVLKPYPYRDDSKHFDPNSADPVPGSKKTQVTIHIISGQQLPKPPQSLLGERGEIIDPYVEVEIIGLPIDCQRAQTKTIQDNGFNPHWDCNMTFTIHLADLALIRFAVWDEDPIGRDFIGQVTMPVRSLMPGYRHVHMEGLDQASLFIHITMEDHDIWAARIQKVKPKGLYCRTKSVELEYSPITGGHKNSPRRRSTLAQMFRRKYSMPIAPSKDYGPPPVTSSRMKRRSYDDSNNSSLEEQSQDDGFKLQQNVTPVNLDSILKTILASGVPVELEADGSTSIHVKYLYKIFSCGISSSSLLTAIREGTVSVWSEEGGYLLTGNYNWDLVEHCRGLSQLGYDEFSDDDEWVKEEIIIKPYSHSNKESLENGLDVIEDTEDSCVCSGNLHQIGCDLVCHSLDRGAKLDSNDNSLAHESFPDIIKSTSLPRDFKQQANTPSPPPPLPKMTEENIEDTSLNSIDSSSNTPGLEEEESMLTDSDDVFLPDIDNTPVCVQNNTSTDQSISNSIPTPDESTDTILMIDVGVDCNDTLEAHIESFNKNPLGKTESSSESCSGSDSTLATKSLVGSTMSISSSLCRDFDSLLTQFDDDSETDAVSMKSRQSVVTTQSDSFTVSDILSMNIESKRNGRTLEETASLDSMDVSLGDICNDVTSQTLDDNISDISGTEYESDTSDGDTLSTTSGEVSLCNGWERCESPNIEQMLGSFNRTDSFTEGSSQDSIEIPTPGNYNMSNQYIVNRYISAVNNLPYEEPPTTPISATCSCSRIGSSRRYRKKSDNKTRCTCSRKSRMMMMQQQAVYNDNNNNADLILIDNVKSQDPECKVLTKRSHKHNSPANVLKKVSKRLSGSDFEASDAVSVSSDSSASSASTVVEVNKDKDVERNLALLQFEDVFAPDEYDTFKNDLMWRWYEAKDESQIKDKDGEKQAESEIKDTSESQMKDKDKSLIEDKDGEKQAESEIKDTSESQMKDKVESLMEDKDGEKQAETHIKDKDGEQKSQEDSSQCEATQSALGDTASSDNASSKENIAVQMEEQEKSNGNASESSDMAHEMPKPFENVIARQSSVLSNPDDDDVFLSDAGSNQDQKELRNSTASPIDDMLQNLCLMVDNETDIDSKTGQSGTKSLTRSNLRKDFAVYQSESQRTGSTNSARNVRFAEVDHDPSRVAVVNPVMKDFNIHRSCLKKQKASTIGPCVQSLTYIHQYNNDCFETPSIVERFYQRNLRGHHSESVLSKLSKSSPHLAMSSHTPKYTSPPRYENTNVQRYQPSYERSQSVLNISQTGRVYEPMKQRCDPAVLLYGTYRPTRHSSSRRKKNVTQPPAPQLPRPPSYEQHIQKYGQPRFLHPTKPTKHRQVEVPPSPIMAQFSTNRDRSATQPAVVRRRDKGLKLEPGGKKRHSTGSYIGMSQERMQEDFSKEWNNESEKSDSPSHNEDKSHGSSHGQRSKLKDRMMYFLLNL